MSPAPASGGVEEMTHSPELKSLAGEKDTARIYSDAGQRVVIKDARSSGEARQEERLIGPAGTGDTQREGRLLIWALKTDREF